MTVKLAQVMLRSLWAPSDNEGLPEANNGAGCRNGLS
ncbi:hypothetical protein VD0002_g5809 [Verticillium dahliae]|uniref:Uncharacterized protein n=1 Tax=Verticillium dahliae TaxID=27337 RepID=A0AA45AN56_VERDA|nr:hypothetical protein BJF96_g3477 [Verticillium dahliae]PNH39251.1 hypothetical protein VD0004_g7638 [Verticillium dahliae]PNH49909.1 hypothetical protein VD0003_g7249 [Verticillium dahliae]PNH62181.1 hypothetical protein VD0002_g5809 [Verticillium dahliae]PNH68266.1 hypothetical protein VD0001_g7537 [Verticillium dahliae]